SGGGTALTSWRKRWNTVKAMIPKRIRITVICPGRLLRKRNIRVGVKAERSGNDRRSRGRRSAPEAHRQRAQREGSPLHWQGERGKGRVGSQQGRQMAHLLA